MTRSAGIGIGKKHDFTKGPYNKFPTPSPNKYSDFSRS